MAERLWGILRECFQRGPCAAYIVRQEAHHGKMDYKAELRELLARHGVAYDEQYVWD